MRLLATVGAIVLLLCGLATAAEEAVFPSQYLQEQEYFSGHWIGEGSVGDDAVKVEHRARWAPGKHCLIVQGATTLKDSCAIQWTALNGYDASTGEIVDCSFAANGYSCVARWKIVSQSESVSKASGVNEGKPFTAEGRIIKRGPDAWTFTSATPDGSPIKVEYKRVKDARKTEAAK